MNKALFKTIYLIIKILGKITEALVLVSFENSRAKPTIDNANGLIDLAYDMIDRAASEAGSTLIAQAAIEQSIKQSLRVIEAEKPSKPKQKRSKHPAANGGKWLRPAKRLAIYLRDNFRCSYCGKNLAGIPAALRSVDHVVPIALGGTNDATNLITCCKRCNDRKQDQSAYSFASDEAFQYISMQLVKPLNIELAKQIIAGTLDLSDVLAQEQGE